MAEEKKATAYVVLKKSLTVDGTDDAAQGWTIVASDVQARNGLEAIRAYAEGNSEQRGNATYVSVPARSWKPVKVASQVKTTLLFGDDEGDEQERP